MAVSRSDPFDLPEWQALHREASLVSQLIGAGVTALGRASYASGFGEYYTAFFGLSIGIERLAKLILVADHALKNAGALPGPNVVRSYGHDLNTLKHKVDQIAECRNLNLKYAKPQDLICEAVLNNLNAFASASHGRYANFEAIGNPNFNSAQEPVNKWWAEVVEPILTKHYRGTAREVKVREDAQINDAVLGRSAFVLYIDEGARPMCDIKTASERTGQTKWAQRYGRYYTLCIVRWMSNIFEELVLEADHIKSYVAFSGHEEFFARFSVSNNFLLNRKTWPLT